jgi:hypothetical protein
VQPAPEELLLARAELRPEFLQVLAAAAARSSPPSRPGAGPF